MRCDVCGQEHDDEEIELSYRMPDAVFALTDGEREARVHESPDFAVLDENRFFVRSVLPIPVQGRDRVYNIGVWAEIDEPAFRRLIERWEDADQAAEPPMPARLANSIRTFPETLGLGLALRMTGRMTRPSVQVQPNAHPLHAEQSQGVTAHRASDFRSRTN